VQGLLVFEKLLPKHGVVHFRIALNPKGGGGVGQWLLSEERHGKNTCKRQKDLSSKIFFMFYS